MSVTFNTQTMKYREDVTDQWSPLMVHVDASVDAVVQDTEPTGSENVWFDTSDATEVSVPTMTDLNSIKDITLSFVKDANAPITVNANNGGQNGRLVIFQLEYTPTSSLNNWTLLGRLAKRPYYQAMGVSDHGNTILLTTTGEVRTLTSTQASGTKQVFYIPYLTNE